MKIQWEYNDFRAIITILNTVLIFKYGFAVAWIGFTIAFFGLCRALENKEHINTDLMYIASLILNYHFMTF